MYIANLKSVVLTAIAFAGLSISSVSQAAGTSLHMEQKNAAGQWILTSPDGVEYTDTSKTKILNNISAGTYRLNLRPPDNAYATIELFENGVSKKTSDMRSMTFDVSHTATYRIKVTYVYGGTVTVRSNPSGVEFVMTTPSGGSYSGTTPATFVDMPTTLYRVMYGLKPDCEAKKILERPLDAGQNLIFTTNIDCGSKRIATPGKTAQHLAHNTPDTSTDNNAPEVTAPTQRVLQTVSAGEAVPGGRVRVTVSVRNIGRQTLRNVTVTDTFNPDMITVVTPLGHDGTVSGNEIQWTVPTIYAGQSWTTSFDVIVKDTVQTGERILLLARAQSDSSDTNQYPETWSSVAGISVAYLPQTGNMLDMMFVLTAMFAAALITNLTIRRQAPVA